MYKVIFLYKTTLLFNQWKISHDFNFLDINFFNILDTIKNIKTK